MNSSKIVKLLSLNISAIRYVCALSVHTILCSMHTHIHGVYGIVVQEEEQLSKVVINPEIHSGSSGQIVPVTAQGDPIEESSGNITSSEVCIEFMMHLHELVIYMRVSMLTYDSL